jgi:hypothetical protein
MVYQEAPTASAAKTRVVPPQVVITMVSELSRPWNGEWVCTTLEEIYRKAIDQSSCPITAAVTMDKGTYAIRKLLPIQSFLLLRSILG